MEPPLSVLGFYIHGLKCMSPIMSLVCPSAVISAVIKSAFGGVDFGTPACSPNLQIYNISRGVRVSALKLPYE